MGTIKGRISAFLLLTCCALTSANASQGPRANDDEFGRADQQRVPIRCCACSSLSSDDVARAGPVLNQNCCPVRLADLIGQQAGENIGAATRCGRNNDLDCASCLGPRTVTG